MMINQSNSLTPLFDLWKGRSITATDNEKMEFEQKMITLFKEKRPNLTVKEVQIFQTEVSHEKEGYALLKEKITKSITKFHAGLEKLPILDNIPEKLAEGNYKKIYKESLLEPIVTWEILKKASATRKQLITKYAERIESFKRWGHRIEELFAVSEENMEKICQMPTSDPTLSVWRGGVKLEEFFALSPQEKESLFKYKHMVSDFVENKIQFPQITWSNICSLDPSFELELDGVSKNLLKLLQVFSFEEYRKLEAFIRLELVCGSDAILAILEQEEMTCQDILTQCNEQNRDLFFEVCFEFKRIKIKKSFKNLLAQKKEEILSQPNPTFIWKLINPILNPPKN